MIVASSLQVAIKLKTGWKTTRVTGARCPVNEYFSGGLGIHSVGDRLSLVGAPAMYSRSVSVSFASRSMTFFCSLITEVHFFSNRPEYFLSKSSSGWKTSRLHTPTDFVRFKKAKLFKQQTYHIRFLPETFQCFCVSVWLQVIGDCSIPKRKAIS